MRQIELIRIALVLLAFMAMIDSLETIMARWKLETQEIRFKWRIWYTCRLLGSASLLYLAFVSPNPFENRFVVPVLAVNFVIALFIVKRFRLGQDGADAQNIIVIALALLSLVVARNHRYQWFSGTLLLVLISDYTCAGLAKLRSPVWRQGIALGLILESPYFAAPVGLPRWMRRTVTSKPMHRAVIAMQLTTPMILFEPLPVKVFMLAVLGSFHIANGALMGLNDFAGVFIPSLLIASTANIDLLRL